MLGFIKSVGSRAINTISNINNKTKIITPYDPNL